MKLDLTYLSQNLAKKEHSSGQSRWSNRFGSTRSSLDLVTRVSESGEHLQLTNKMPLKRDPKRRLIWEEQAPVKSAKVRPTQEQVKAILDYNPETGKFIWKVSIGTVNRVGREAGSICGDGKYRYIGINGERFTAQHLAWLYVHGEWPNGVVDHIDRDSTNNAISNLRVTDKSGNAMNNKARQREDFGVYRYKAGWKVQFYINKKNKHFGCFDTYEEAVARAQQIREQLDF